MTQRDVSTIAGSASQGQGKVKLFGERQTGEEAHCSAESTTAFIQGLEVDCRRAKEKAQRGSCARGIAEKDVAEMTVLQE